jgi:myo-inositol-1(or 4)-monophosphatase
MLPVAVKAAQAAADIIRRSSARRIEHKGDVDLVTEVDLACESAIREVLERETPGIPILGEEGGGAVGASTRWIVDPLDGTTNFVHGFPAYCVCIALEDRGELRAGVILDPVRDRCYSAEKGRGATMNGERMRVSGCSSLDTALLASGFPYDRRRRAAELLRYVQAFLERSQGFRRAGSAGMDLAFVASGALDGYWEFGLHPWDVAAGIVLVREAGGAVTDVAGGDLDLDAPRILASNGAIHDEMLAVLADLLDT